MAFSTTPESQTNKTQRFPFFNSPDQISGSSITGSRLINMYPEVNNVPLMQKNTYYVKKRPGLKPFIDTNHIGGEGRGIYNWRGGIYSVIDNKLYANENEIYTINTHNGHVGFAEYYGQTFGQVLIMVDGVDGYIINGGNAITKITDPNFPSPHIPYPVVIDEYVLLAKKETNDFYQSELDNPASWVPGDFNSAEMFADEIRVMTKFKNYLVIGGKQSVEFFYDSGNPSGSSFQRSEAVIQQVGCRSPQSMQTTEESIIYVGTTGEGGVSVWEIEKFKAVDIANPTVRMALDNEKFQIEDVSAVIIRCAGHQWYMLTLLSKTFVYDVELKIWHEWSYNGSAMPFKLGTESNVNNPLLLETYTGKIYEMDQAAFTDAGQPIVCTIQTDKINFGSWNRKYWDRLIMFSDYGTNNSTITLFWSPDDFETLYGGRIIQLASQNPYTRKLGMFRELSFQFQFIEDNPLRLEYFEIDADVMLH